MTDHTDDNFGRTALYIALGMAAAFIAVILAVWLIHRLETQQEIRTESQQYNAHMQYLARRADQRERYRLMAEREELSRALTGEGSPVAVPYYRPPPPVPLPGLDDIIPPPQ